MLAFLTYADIYQFWDGMTILKRNKSKVKPLVSPMRLLIRTYPDLAKMALDRCMGTNLANPTKPVDGVVILGDLN